MRLSSSASPLTVSILTVGNELLDGRVLDTNAHRLIELCEANGFLVQRVSTVKDDISEITAALRFLLSSDAHVLVAGGLGPTLDDLTRSALAQLIGAPLERSQMVVDHLKAFFASRRRAMNETNLRQADFPAGAEILPNPAGTAPGFTVLDPESGRRIFCLPGVPHELERMAVEQVVPRLQALTSSSNFPAKLLLKCFGRAESEIGACIEQAKISSNIEVGYRAHFPEIHLSLTSRVGDRAALEAARQAALSAIDPQFVFTEKKDESLGDVVGCLLKQQGATITCAESCTGGLLAARCTATPGASEVFKGSIITYDNRVKSSELGVSNKIFEEHGAVSAECALAMADGARKRFLASLSLAITGIAGPSGGSEAKPVGTFFVGISTVDRNEAFRYFSAGSRERIREYAVMTALDVARRHLLGLPLRNGSPS